MSGDLELIETDALLEELFSRFDHACFVGLKDRDDSTYAVRIRWHGNSYTVSGLCQRASMRAIEDWEAGCDDAEGEDL